MEEYNDGFESDEDDKYKYVIREMTVANMERKELRNAGKRAKIISKEGNNNSGSNLDYLEDEVNDVYAEK